MKKIQLLALSLASALLFPACSLTDRLIYRIDIQQGNVITQSMLSKLEYGMSKEDVLQAIGRPVLRDPFHRDDWHYIYTLRKGWESRQQRNLVLRFRNDQLLKVEGDVRIADPDSTTQAEQQATLRRSLVIPDAEPRGLLQKLFSKNDSQEETTEEAAERERAAAAADEVTSDPGTETHPN